MNMELKQITTNKKGETVELIYREDDPLKDLEGKILREVRVWAFYGDKLVIVNGPAKGWEPAGGGIESGETIADAVVREIQEETNMEVLRQELIGYQDIYAPDKIRRFVFLYASVKPLDDFAVDPDGDIIETKLIEPQNYKEYFNYGEIGDRVMSRAIEKNNKNI